MPEPAGRGSRRLPAGAVPGRQPRALPMGVMPQSTPACAHLPALTCPLKCHTGRAGSGFSVSPQGAALSPAPARFGDRAEPLPRCPGQQQPGDVSQAAESCLLFLALVPDLAHCSGAMGDPRTRGTPHTWAANGCRGRKGLS